MTKRTTVLAGSPSPVTPTTPGAYRAPVAVSWENATGDIMSDDYGEVWMVNAIDPNGEVRAVTEKDWRVNGLADLGFKLAEST